MAFVRLSIMKPNRGQAERVETMLRELAETVAKNPGCIQSMLLAADDGTGELGRIAVYESAEAANDSANNAHVMALRSELHLIVEPGHVERSFETL
jgi:quinol monooxygenase YgiN